jgi:peptide/nickel transport system ATP-binding protein
MVFQDSKSALHPLIRIENQVAEEWTAHGRCSRGRAIELAREALARVGLDPERVGRSYSHELSGGMRQRVQIATALALNPALLELDEPSTALDTVTQKQIFDLVDLLRRRHGFATLLVTHDLPLAKERSDRVVRLERGRIVDVRRSADVVLARPVRPAASPGAEPPECVLEARSLAVAYARRGVFLSRSTSTRVVEDASLAIAAGETVALVGNSGSGKTSFVRGLLRLVEPVAGAVLYRPRAGAPVVDLRALDAPRLRATRPALGIVFQDPATSLDPRQRARDVLAEALSVRAVTPRESDEAIMRILEGVGLSTAHLERFPHQLSGGEAQRLCVARALATKPRVLVLDEALSSLDPTTRTRILDLLARLRREEGLACLLVTHDLASVETCADRVAVMAHGHIVECGATERVFAAPVHAQTRALLEARPGFS